MEDRRIREADSGDAPVISRIFAASWKTAYVGMVPQEYLDGLSEDHWTGHFKKRVADDDWTVQVACEGEQAVGAIVYGKSKDSAMPGYGEIEAIYLLPSHIGCGMGRLLMDAALDGLARRGYADCFLWVLRENVRAKRFYQKHGFAWTEDICEVELAGRTLVDQRMVRSLRGQ
ncbi:GNAT family N-acetyltransferase [Candidatus Soleaferrea massiliensis]|uniref:GNAT family N-acetyltransferase n=1 Tax=Candidatus Soleaferrea massiliensis TaxID=1470354 RepID=UPI00058B844A|nr:GNAT family N-acetyltransferase [Candidatus Soleaferrea massiliensis]